MRKSISYDRYIHLLMEQDLQAAEKYKNEFVPNLSIIDVLMFNGKNGTKRLLSEYTLF